MSGKIAVTNDYHFLHERNEYLRGKNVIPYTDNSPYAKNDTCSQLLKLKFSHLFTRSCSGSVLQVLATVALSPNDWK